MSLVSQRPGGSGLAVLWDSKSYTASFQEHSYRRDNEPLPKTMACSVLAFPLHAAQMDIGRLDLISEMLVRGVSVALLNKALGHSAEKMKLEGRRYVPVALLLLSATQLQAIPILRI